MIDADVLVTGSAFSFTQQPYLRHLFDVVTTGTRPLVLVVGAGVSMNAGLPSWNALLERMSGALPEPFKTMVLLDTADAPRRAERILQLARAHNPNPRAFEFIRDALYPVGSIVQPGDLAKSIARLVAAGNGRVRVVTTNYDPVIEMALRTVLPNSDVTSYGLRQAVEWASTADAADISRVGVLHLHGMVLQGADPIEPLVLTESHFLRYGHEVRSILTGLLEHSDTLFLGLSVTDPNVVGPLFDRAVTATPDANPAVNEAPRAFTLTVPDPVAGAVSWAEEAAYAVESARYLDGTLKLRPIFLKSYSQLDHVVSDLALASQHPKQYRLNPGRSGPSLVYGKRFDAALNGCYEAIGCTTRQDLPIGDAAARLHDRLHDALHARGGPAAFLQQRASPNNNIGVDEHFALFLWLRTRTKAAKMSTPYAITMVGSSVYLHREPWSATREVVVGRRSTYSAAQAVFNGSLQVANLHPRPHSDTWRGIIAFPVTLEAARSTSTIGGAFSDVLTVGALTLNSTHRAKVSAKDHADGPTSSITTLSALEFQELARTLRTAVQTVLRPDDGS